MQVAFKIEDEPSGFVKKGKGFHLASRSGSRTLVVFFSSTGKKGDRFDFWGAGHRSTENILFVNDPANHWYQRGVEGLGKSIEKTINSIRRFQDMVGADRVVTVGSSMGGYGAVLYGALLNADVLAFSFDSVLRLPSSPSEKHMPLTADIRHRDLLPIVEASSARVHIFAGEMHMMDIVGANHLAALPNVTVQTLRGVGHDSARHLNITMGIDRFIQAVAADRSMPSSPVAGSLLSSPAAISALHDAHLLFRADDFEGCVAKATEALKVEPFSELARYLLGRAFLKLKKPSNAAVHFGYVAAALPDFEDGQFYFAHALRLAKRSVQAIELLERHVARWPASARGHYDIGMAREALGNSAAAKNSVRTAAKINPHYAGKIAELYRRAARA